MRKIVRRVKTTFRIVEIQGIFDCLSHSLFDCLLIPFRFPPRDQVGIRQICSAGGRLVPQVVPDCQQNFKFILGTCSSGFRRSLRGQLCHDYRAMKQRKDQLIKARVSTDLKRGINDLADERGESEAVIIREALSQYLTSKQKCNRQDWLSVISDGSAKRPQKNKNLKHKL